MIRQSPATLPPEAQDVNPPQHVTPDVKPHEDTISAHAAGPPHPTGLPPTLLFGDDGPCGGYGGLDPAARNPPENLVDDLALDGSHLPKDPSGNPWAPA